MKGVGRTITGLALSVCVAGVAVPADARSWHHHHHHGGGDDAAIAIGAGIVGLGIGVALGSDHGRGPHSYDYGPYYGSYYGPPPYRAYYGYRSYWPGYYPRHHRYRGGCYTRRIYDPYIGRRVRVRYCR